MTLSRPPSQVPPGAEPFYFFLGVTPTILRPFTRPFLTCRPPVHRPAGGICPHYQQNTFCPCVSTSVAATCRSASCYQSAATATTPCSDFPASQVRRALPLSPASLPRLSLLFSSASQVRRALPTCSLSGPLSIVI